MSGLSVPVTVVDYGIGAEQDVDYPEVAEPVARAVAAGEVDRAILVCGTGLGMAISKKIVEAHEGTINVVSEQGRGAEFIISLPLPNK